MPPRRGRPRQRQRAVREAPRWPPLVDHERPAPEGGHHAAGKGDVAAPSTGRRRAAAERGSRSTAQKATSSFSGRGTTRGRPCRARRSCSPLHRIAGPRDESARPCPRACPSTRRASRAQRVPSRSQARERCDRSAGRHDEDGPAHRDPPRIRHRFWFRPVRCARLTCRRRKLASTENRYLIRCARFS